MVVQHHAVLGWRIRIGGWGFPQLHHPGFSPRSTRPGRWGQLAYRLGSVPRLRSWHAPVSAYHPVHMVVYWPTCVRIGESPLPSMCSVLFGLAGAWSLPSPAHVPYVFRYDGRGTHAVGGPRLCHLVLEVALLELLVISRLPIPQSSIIGLIKLKPSRKLLVGNLRGHTGKLSTLSSECGHSHTGLPFSPSLCHRFATPFVHACRRPFFLSDTDNYSVTL